MSLANIANQFARVSLDEMDQGSFVGGRGARVARRGLLLRAPIEQLNEILEIEFDLFCVSSS